MNSSN